MSVIFYVLGHYFGTKLTHLRDQPVIGFCRKDKNFHKEI